MLTPEQLLEIRKRADAATPGPWSCVLRTWLAGESVNSVLRGDITFLSNASQDILTLLDHIEWLTRERDDYYASMRLLEEALSKEDEALIAERDALAEKLKTATEALKHYEGYINPFRAITPESAAYEREYGTGRVAHEALTRIQTKQE